MPSEITMPQLSDTMTEGAVVKWRKKEGEKVKQGDIIAEIETDKAVMEQESFEAGTLAMILVPEGQKVKVGGVLAVLAQAGEKVEDVKKQYASRGASAATETAPASTKSAPKKSARAAAEQAPPQAGGGGVATLEAASTSEVHEPAETGHGATRTPASAVPSVPHGDGNGQRVFASPLARRIALDHHLDLRQLHGSGPGGRIVQKDVLEALERPSRAVPATAAAPSSARPAGATQSVPLTKMRAAIAAALQKSKQTIPHFYETIDADVEDLLTLRARINEQLKAENVKVSLADFITKSVASALLRHLAVNSTFDGTTITHHADVHMGIAVAVPDGLIVPVLKHADKMGLREIREKSAGIIERARAGKQRQDEATGGTFTISSLGTYGVREFSPIINPPQVAILAVGAAEKRPVVRNDQIVPRTMLTLTLSADHRVVDGATAAEFLRTLKSMLEEPGMMLI